MLSLSRVIRMISYSLLLFVVARGGRNVVNASAGFILNEVCMFLFLVCSFSPSEVCCCVGRL